MKKTFIVIGCPRGGTTMIAKLLQTSGVYMGRGLTGNLEDYDFRTKNYQKILKIIDKRNLYNDVWGWKYPGLSDMSQQDILSIIQYCINPYVIFVTRDVNAIAISANRRGNAPYPEFITAALNLYQNIMPLVHVTNNLVISYEHALTRPEKVAKDFINFTGLDVSIGELVDVMKPIENKDSYNY